ncbi:MAG: pirin family protein [Deltaproteobacteria bacterium]|nr:pirin family protein [Deltaproteobacteria bacterium]
MTNATATTPGTRLRDPGTIVAGQAASDGAGVRLLRSLGTGALPLVDPFLMLDEFRSDDASDYIAGFPDHPHRGFETVTVMLAGRMQHRDSVGNRGDLGPGSVQWMTAGRGIIHSEMPQQHDGLMWGFQLWVNLPAAHKLTAPRYQDIDASEIPSATTDAGASVRVIAGTVDGTRGPIEAVTEPVLLDIRLGDGGSFEHALPPGHNAFVYVYEGSVEIVGASKAASVERGKLVVLGAGDAVKLRANTAAKALLVAGRPIGEPVARYGPFVMNTQAELEQAFRDYRSGALGR